MGLRSEPAAAQVAPAPFIEIMQEPGEVVDVIDAFDDDNDDVYDFNFRLDFGYTSKRARITRESAVFAPGLTTGGFTSRRQNVGRYIETTSRLSPRLDFGLYKDLALYTRLPIILDNRRRIDDIDGTAGNISAATGGAPGETLFVIPFEAPSRSGIEHLAVGIDWGIFNQSRDHTKPTWIFGVEGRFAIGTPMHACNANPAQGQVACAHPGDIDRNGQFDADAVSSATGDPLESQAIDTRGAGVTRGTASLELHSLISKRLKYIEPYGGFTAAFEFPLGNSDFGETDLEGTLVNLPPVVGTVLVGMMIHPWEDREDFGRLTFDLRFQGEYHSEGRDYSELFDALGSSAAPSLRNPRWSRFRACEGAECDVARSVVDQGSQRTYFSGLTVVEPYGSYRGAGSVTYRTGKYVKLNAGVGLRFDQPHGITHDQPCNPDFAGDVDPSRAGPCQSTTGGNVTGIPNPAYRPTINAVGRRFYVDQSITYEVFASGTVMF
ncbi:MAG: hypothetical protein AAF715_14880 [Myxococcota bacterium]